MLSGQRCLREVEVPQTQCGNHCGFPLFQSEPVKKRRRELAEGAQCDSESSGDEYDDFDANHIADGEAGQSNPCGVVDSSATLIGVDCDGRLRYGDVADTFCKD